jgi:hypothetical protein
METEFRIETLGSNLRRFILIDNSPSLIDSVMSLINNNFLSFLILTLVYIKNLFVSDVDKVGSSVLEDLPPSRAGAPDLHVL